jgi:hypothetical protein
MSEIIRRKVELVALTSGSSSTAIGRSSLLSFSSGWGRGAETRSLCWKNDGRGVRETSVIRWVVGKRARVPEKYIHVLILGE